METINQEQLKREKKIGIDAWCVPGVVLVSKKHQK